MKEEYTKIIRRLHIIQGQITGLERLIQEEAECTKVLTQVKAVVKGVRSVGDIIAKEALEKCVTKETAQKEALISDILKLYGTL
ncbi:metal-sensitive transcriptional regulator [Candidatus Parcubacteria bacterium]|uniref:Transcriptional regulator n=1 Tax=Candidatus Magasanikbacteria bacterium CG10_big_fil_rev_8_21_14_0_10_38_6 TaxID=1974647 RepID=A0A2M6P167_9BACT|nr:metal-sensitive transcriptional regulator [Candidatus Parcubacteria bacterium]PIR77465.1 MAG: hypothetical protein COU30_02320 [Candidatus Magasanikbacteria bacterium CG10_big_fil_rev_8_21_14_0_10_38_6]